MNNPTIKRSARAKPVAVCWLSFTVCDSSPASALVSPIFSSSAKAGMTAVKKKSTMPGSSKKLKEWSMALLLINCVRILASYSGIPPTCWSPIPTPSNGVHTLRSDVTQAAVDWRPNLCRQKTGISSKWDSSNPKAAKVISSFSSVVEITFATPPEKATFPISKRLFCTFIKE